jgi:glycerol-3-phosphate acyltransferase PlsY
MAIVAILIGYLLGSISTSTILGRLVAGIDIREHGSGNAGATNTLRVLGPKLAGVVFLLDALKGVIAVVLARWLEVPDTFVVLTGVAVIAGHNWPVFFNFRGGKGIATTIGVMFSLVPAAALGAALIALIALLLTRYVSLASMIFTCLLPIIIANNGYHQAYIWFGVVVAVLSLWRHRENIKRLLKGRENKIGLKRQLQ